MAGDVSGPAGQRPNTQAGGLAIRVNAIDQGVRGNVNFVDTPGVQWAAADQPLPAPARMTVTASIQAELLLASATGIDLVPGGAAVLLLSALAQTRVQVTRVQFIAESVTGAGTQPIVEVGTDTPGNPPNDDVKASGALALTATDQIEEASLLTPRPSIDQTAPNDVLRMRQTGAATSFTTYVVGIQVWGTIVTP